MHCSFRLVQVKGKGWSQEVVRVRGWATPGYGAARRRSFFDPERGVVIFWMACFRVCENPSGMWVISGPASPPQGCETSEGGRDDGRWRLARGSLLPRVRAPPELAFVFSLWVHFGLFSVPFRLDRVVFLQG